ncbi:hypothetical protein, partial [Kitasatospora atroaurantiaca]|uniref:hypothetical protein n=1 Tax=Kitasatospora atroaurantiaca TaxID=285545 RepID=UPI0031CFD107
DLTSSQKCLSVSDEDEVAVGHVLKLFRENEQLSRRLGFRGGRVVKQSAELGDDKPYLRLVEPSVVVRVDIPEHR